MSPQQQTTGQRIAVSAVTGVAIGVATIAMGYVASACLGWLFRRRSPDAGASHGHGGLSVPLPKPSTPPRAFTVEELGEHVGTKGPDDVYMSIRGVVYQVSPQFYGPGAAYSIFAGTDATRNLAKGLLNGSEANADWSNLSKDHLETLAMWEARIQEKYPQVGWLVMDDAFKARGAAMEP